MDNLFYTYAYLREDGTPYYIGKGKGRRAFKREHRLPVPPRERILFLKRNLTEEEAFRHEIYMIAVLGRKDLGTGILRNLCDGGEGVSGRPVGEAEKQRRSEAQRGKVFSKKHRERMGNSIREAWDRRKEEDPTHLEKMRQRMSKIAKDPKVREKIHNGISKWWRITFTSGCSIEVKNLTQWAKEKGYTPARLYEVSKGKTNSHRDIASVEKLVR